jgi:hypothetical protein
MSLPVNGHRASFLGVKRLGSEADRSAPSNSAVKNEWSYPSTNKAYKYSKFCKISIESVVLVRLCVYLADYDPVEIETRMRNTSLAQIRTRRLLYEIWITLNLQVLG